VRSSRDPYLGGSVTTLSSYHHVDLSAMRCFSWYYQRRRRGYHSGPRPSASSACPANRSYCYPNFRRDIRDFQAHLLCDTERGRGHFWPLIYSVVEAVIGSDPRSLVLECRWILLHEEKVVIHFANYNYSSNTAEENLT
jgi:hypothetical protein